jgi:seryl-tRNA synthetase
MLDIKLLRENPDLVRKNLERRQDPEKLRLLEEVIGYDGAWRSLTAKVNGLRRARNQISSEVARLKQDGKDASERMRDGDRVQEAVKEAEAEEERYQGLIREGLMRLPNMLHESVPFGKDENDNVEIRRWGEPPKFDFEPRGHVDVALNLGIIDEARAGKASGAGFVYLKKGLALLDYAILRFAMDFLIGRGYTLVEPPFMIKRRPYEGVTSLEDFENVLYKIEGEDLYLIATSEHAIAAMYMDEVLNAEDLPIKFVGVSPCFRKEVGTHGKYTKGLFRMHHFNKVEQFIFSLPEDSWGFHEELQRNSEELYQALGLHYRVVNVCTGDIGILAAKKYDTEVWMTDGAFREIGSNSNCTDYQARRLNIRYREKEGQAPKGFVHTLNNTALATSRTMMAILEQYQQEDGSVVIPEALRPYMNGLERIEKKEP